MKKIITIVALCGLISACTTTKTTTTTTTTPTQAAQAPQMSHEQMMAAWEKAGTPGDAHKTLNAFAGKWNTTTKSYYSPDGTPAVSKGSVENSWILGGRFLQEKYKGQMMGKPFEGLALTGYDNSKGAYVSTWTDNMTTGVMNSTGTFDPQTKTFTYLGSYTCPVTGQTIYSTMKSQLVSNDKHMFEMYEAFDPKGADQRKVLEIEYTRAGKAKAATN
ncbi:DUF1579 domain-containing protein [bacterium]|nr:DUF1579 domain-containing protein [bacterium]